MPTRTRSGLLVVCLLAGVVTVACEQQPGSTGASVDSAAVIASLSAAEQYLGAGDTASAEAILIKLLDKMPGDYRAHELYGRVLYLEAAVAGGQAAIERLARAHDHYRTAVELATEAAIETRELAGLNQSAGEIGSVAGRRAEALGHFREAGRLDPSNPKHPLYAAQILVQLDDLDEAKAALQRVLVLDPDEAFAYASLASIALAEADRDGAIRHIEAARAIDADSLAIRLQAARIRRRCDQPKRGLELLLGLDDKTRAQEAVAAEIAACYARLGEPAKAAAAWEHRFWTHPHHPTAWRAAVRAAHVYLAAGDIDRAREWSTQARLVAAPGEPEVEALKRAIESAPDPEL